MRDLAHQQIVETERRNGSMDSSLENRIIINISGVRFETFKSTLEVYPNTLLGNAKRRKYYYDNVLDEYFFDRHRGCFEAILYYYQSKGRLRRPNSVPLDTFLEEITFFDLGQDALAQVLKDENLKEVEKAQLPRNRCRRYIWATIEYPEFSFIAKLFNIISYGDIVPVTVLGRLTAVLCALTGVGTVVMMKVTVMIFTIVMAIFLINIINGNPVKRYSNHLFKSRLASLLEEKRHASFDDFLEVMEPKASKQKVYFHDEDERDENNYLQRNVRKVIGLADDPF
ncbi:unnamed protein product [Rotaria sordida]|uniref:BTB domain-containing protein n=1 Tax=Rotaria sordida TaxID=392033 RepID=A0A814L848_9BILA|nr:unnamed protein product [Rotaria sordida]CAF3819594.1 unnamed protein product [Rotaria sordida]